MYKNVSVMKLNQKYQTQKLFSVSLQLSGKATNLVQAVIKQTYEKAEECLNTNYYGCKRVTEALLPLLKLWEPGLLMFPPSGAS